MQFSDFQETIATAMFNAIDAMHNYRSEQVAEIEIKAIYDIMTHFLCQIVEHLDEDERATELTAQFIQDFKNAKTDANSLESTLIDICTFTDYLKHEELQVIRDINCK